MGFKGKINAAVNVLSGKRKLSWTEVAVPCVFIFYFVMRAVDRVFNTRISKILANPVYNTVYSNIIFPIGLFLAQLVLSLGYIAVMRYYFKDRRYNLWFLSPFSELASTNGAYPQYLLCLFIIGDALNNLLIGWGGPFLDQTMQNLLTQFTLVFTVIFAYIFLKTRYKAVHYVACMLVIMSVLQSVTVEIQTNDPPIGQYKRADGTYASTSILYFMMFFLSTIPSAGGNVFKQWCLQGIGAKHGELDVMYGSFWSSFFQILVSLVLLMTVWIPFPGVAVPVTPGTTGKAIADTFTCFVGRAPADADDFQKTLCTLETGSALQWFIIYSVFNLSFNVTLLWLTKYLSTTWTQVANVCVLALSSLLGMSPAIFGDAAQPISVEQYFGIILGIVALWVYNLEDEVDVNGDDIYLINKRKQEEIIKIEADSIEDLEGVKHETVNQPQMEDPNNMSSSNVLYMAKRA